MLGASPPDLVDYAPVCCTQGLWSTVILVLRGKSRDYQVQAHTGGPIFIVPEEFSEKNLMKFLGETLLSHA